MSKQMGARLRVYGGAVGSRSGERYDDTTPAANGEERHHVRSQVASVAMLRRNFFIGHPVLLFALFLLEVFIHLPATYSVKLS